MNTEPTTANATANATATVTGAAAVPTSNNVFDTNFDLNQALSERQYSDLIPLFLICSFALWHLATNIWLVEPGIWQNCIHYAGFALLAAITTSAYRTSASAPSAQSAPSAHGTVATLSHSRARFSFYSNIIFGIAIAASALWLCLLYTSDAADE